MYLQSFQLAFFSLKLLYTSLTAIFFFFFKSDYLAVFTVPWALLFILKVVSIIDTRKQKLGEYNQADQKVEGSYCAVDSGAGLSLV